MIFPTPIVVVGSLPPFGPGSFQRGVRAAAGDRADVLVRLDDEAGILTRRAFDLRDGLFFFLLAAPAYLSTRRHN
jgi:hypothetical protein